jgi:hypothetical protein
MQPETKQSLLVADEAVNIAPRAPTMADLCARMGTLYTTSRSSFLLPKAGITGPYPEKEEDFHNQCLESVEFDVRIYTVEPHNVEIVIPETYAKKLEEVRKLRTDAEQATACCVDLIAPSHPVDDLQSQLGRHKYRNRLLQEDVVALLDELPDSSYFTRVYLVDWDNPQDVWLRQLYQNDKFVSAASTNKEREVHLYKTENNMFVRTNLFHEWAHKFRDDHFQPDELEAFDDSLELEWRVYVPDYYALKSYGEHFAVLSQELLHVDGKRFMDAARRAPMRSCVWMRVFKRILAALPENRRSIYHQQFLNRCLWVDQNVHIIALELLEKEIKRAGTVRDFLTVKRSAREAAA